MSVYIYIYMCVFVGVCISENGDLLTNMIFWGSNRMDEHFLSGDKNLRLNAEFIYKNGDI